MKKELLAKIDTLINMLNWVNWKEFKYYTIDELTRIWWTLAIYQYNLIEYELESFIEVKKAERDVDEQRFDIRKSIVLWIDNQNKDKKVPAKDIDIKVDAILSQYKLTRDLKEADLIKITALKFYINTIVWRIESRIKYLMSDINNKFKNEE
jgi:hypothetical protein